MKETIASNYAVDDGNMIMKYNTDNDTNLGIRSSTKAQKFVFAVMAYNQQNEILLTLNSIKYQILQYGEDIINTLIITDDGSKDRTTEAIDSWLEKNGALFEHVIKRFNFQNKGIVDNYHYILDRIEDIPFKIIAGDDVISRQNIYLSASVTGDSTLYVGAEFFFKDNRVYLEQSWLNRHFYLLNCKVKKTHYLTLFKMGYVISTPQTIYSKKLYNDSNAKELNSTFKLFEDNPTWYSMIKNVPNLNIMYEMNPVALYRISEKSVSNRTREVNTAFQKELYKLHDQYIQDGGLFDRMYFKSLRSNVPKFLNFSKYINHVFLVHCWLYCQIHKKKFKIFMNNINDELIREQKFLSYLTTM